ncbi:MAG: class I SAM-dependent methyltransferase [Gemmatimonadota bacterium]|nr:class I SAM-dependent methyltransferase [Gemmatimonadota bacterium]
MLNVGAGTGSYEPVGPYVVAVEPSRIMIAQRDSHAAPAVCAVAEALPFASGTFDVVLGVLTMHHWQDLSRGLSECQRVARKRVVFFSWDPDATDFWLIDDYFPQFREQARALFPTMQALHQMLGEAHVIHVPIPSDCADGFLGAYWKRPTAYLDATVRSGMSAFALVDNIDEPLKRLEQDVSSGAWSRRNQSLAALGALDLGYRLVVADVV